MKNVLETTRMAIRRTLVLVFVLSAVWTGIVAFTGGVVWRIDSFRISSRDPWRPLLIAIAAALGALALTGPAAIRSALSRGWERCRLAVMQVAPRLHGASWRLAIAIAVAGILLDLYRWSRADTFWLDEEMIALNFRDRSFANLSGPLWLEQSAPYGWLVLQRAVLLTLGDGERALRLVPLLFGIATVVGALWVGRRWLGAVGLPGLVLLSWIAPALSHYRFEVKHYTGDVFFALMMPALVAWAIEGQGAKSRVRRAVIFWMTAALGQFLANGALLVTPGCLMVLLAAVWRRDGWRTAAVAAAGGIFWLAAVAGHYEVSLRFTAYLREYWRHEFPPGSDGAAAILQWSVNRLELLASNPAGTARWVTLWILATAGFAFGGARWLAGAFATVPVSAMVYAVAGLVPLYQRFSIWIVPALYVGVMLIVDRTVQAIRPTWNRHQWSRVAVAFAIAMVAFRLGSDIVARGYDELSILHPPAWQLLDDRAAVRSLMAQRRPGDEVITTRLGWPAVWWYGRISIGSGTSDEVRPDGYVMSYVKPGSRCRSPALNWTPPPDTRRLLVYLGFPDEPAGFERVLQQVFDQVGETTSYREFASKGRLFVVDLERPPTGANRSIVGNPGDAPEQLRGCVLVGRLRRW